MKTPKFKSEKKIAKVESFKKKRESQMRAVKDKMKHEKKTEKKLVYKSGMEGDQPIDWSKKKKGIITSID